MKLQSDIGEVNSISEVVLLKIRNAILRGEIKPGEKIIVSRLAEQLGVSRTRVRESLQKLDLEGLVEAYPRRHYVVRGITWEDIEEIVKIRANLEGLVVEKVCEKKSSQVIDKIRKVMQYTEKDLHNNNNDNNGYTQNIVHINERFHYELIEAAESKRLSLMLNNLYDYINFFRDITVRQPQRPKETIHEHVIIFKHIINNDKDAAVQAMNTHIRNTLSYLREGWRVIQNNQGENKELEALEEEE